MPFIGIVVRGEFRGITNVLAQARIAVMQASPGHLLIPGVLSVERSGPPL